MNKWSASYSAVKNWIHEHIDKINDHNINIIANKNFSRYKENEETKILEEVKNSNFSTEAINEIAKNNNTIPAVIRKLIKKLDSLLYINLETSITDIQVQKAKEVQSNRLNYLRNIDKENFNLKEMQEYFDMELAGLIPWILKHDKDLYIHIKSPLVRCCPECHLMNIKKKGTVKSEVPLQKYQCKDCNHYFNYLLL